MQSLFKHSRLGLGSALLCHLVAASRMAPSYLDTFWTLNFSTITVVALKRWCVVGKAAAVNGALLSEKIWRRDWRRHDSGFMFRRKQMELLAADVEASGTDERAPPGRSWTRCNGPRHWRSRRRAWGRWPASRLQWKVIWDKDKPKVSDDLQRQPQNNDWIPEDGDSLYSEAGLLPLNRNPESENEMRSQPVMPPTSQALTFHSYLSWRGKGWCRGKGLCWGAQAERRGMPYAPGDSDGDW